MTGTFTDESIVEFWEKLVTIGGEQAGLRRTTLNLKVVGIGMVREASEEEGGGTFIDTHAPEWHLHVNEDYVEVLTRLGWLKPPEIPRKT